MKLSTSPHPRWAPVVSAAVAAFVLSGCAAPSLTTVNLHPDPSVVGAFVQVDVISTTTNNEGAADYAVSKYWEPGDPFRAAAGAQNFHFGAGQLDVKSITVPKGADSVVVIADLPGVFADLPGSSDARRKVIPVTGKGVKSVADLAIDRTGVHIMGQ